MKKTGPAVSAFLITLISAQLSLAVTDLYVSPKGSDANPGTKRKPFATLQKARDAARALPADAKADGVTIHLRKGTHSLSEVLVLTPEDSGSSAEAPLSWMGEKGTVISSGREITGWKDCGNGTWKTKIDWLKEGQVFYTLFADGDRLTRARTPDAGTYHYTRQLIFDKKSGKSCTGMFYYPETIPDDIQTPEAHIVLFHKWVTSQNFVGNVDKTTEKIMFAGAAGIFLFTPETRFYVDGVRSALTSPDEWFLDPESKELYLIPPEGKNPNRLTVTAPCLKTALIVVSGNPEAGDKVKNLVFENIAFEYVDANLTKDHPKSVQGAHKQWGAITATGLHNSTIRNCTFSHIGENGICLLNGCQSNMIERNHIFDMGCGGVYMPEQKPGKATPENLCGYNTVQDNLIHDGGIIFRAGVGVFLGGNASHNKILHNEIFNLSWMGIHTGWSWSGLVPTATHHNEIGFNHIHQIGNGVLCDIGGIYTIGVSPGTTIHNNHIHDITRYTRGRTGYGGWGIYNDAGSSQITVTSNVVYNTQDGGYHLHNDNFPWGNKACNNIFAIADAAQLKRNNVDDTKKPCLHLVFENNIVYCTNNLVYGGGNWKTNSAFSANRNCFYSTSDEAMDFAGHDFRTWQKAGKDVNSLIANPMFKDADNYDFRIDPKSPAITLGFKPFDYTQAGLSKGNPLRKQIKKFPLRPVEVAPVDKRPFKIDESFEKIIKGCTPSASHITKQVKGKGYIVTDEQAASGRQSLKVADAPVFKHSYEPHLCHYIPTKSGTWKIAFDLFHTEGANISFETRDWPSGKGYKSGPMIRITADGTVKAGSESFKIKSGKWTSFEVELTQGAGTWPTWNLIVNAGKADEKKFTSLSTTPGFTIINWFGFISPDKKESVVYLDNIKAEVVN